MLLHSIAIGAALFPVDQSDSKDLETQTQPLPEDDKLFHWHILKCKPFLVYCVAYYLLTVGTALAFVHWPVFMVKGLGRTSQEAAHVLMSTGLASLVSRPLIGLSQQWINVYYATSICCLINAAAFVCLPLSPLFVLNIIGKFNTGVAVAVLACVQLRAYLGHLGTTGCRRWATW